MAIRILLVEDNPDLLELTQMGLKSLGYEVRTAKDGEEAVRMSIAERPSVIIMDLIMPRMNGLQAAARIRQNPETKNIPILAATGMASYQERKRAVASGCSGYLTKPYSLFELRKTIHAVFERHARPARNQPDSLEIETTVLITDRAYSHAENRPAA